MQPGNYNMTILQGATFRVPFRWLDNGVGVDISALNARMQIRERIQSTGIIHELTTSNGGILFTDAANGEFQLYISPSDTETFDFCEAVYDIEFFNNTDVIRLFQGSITLSKEVTR